MSYYILLSKFMVFPLHTFSIKLVFVLTCLFLTVASHGAVVDGLHRSEVEINSQQKAAREEAFNAALVKVLIKLSGHENRVSDPEIQRQFFPAERYVQSFAYRENPDYQTYLKQRRRYEEYLVKLETASDDAGVTGLSESVYSEPATPLTDAFLANPPKPFVLDVEFSPRGVEAQMKQVGLPIWGSVRPEILFWVLLESEGERVLIGEEIVKAYQDELLDKSQADEVDLQLEKQVVQTIKDKPMIAKTPSLIAYESFAQASGKFALPLIFPKADELDKSQVQISDLWGLFPDAVDIAKQRYSANGQAMVRILHSLDGHWTANWHLTVSDSAYTGNVSATTLPDISDEIVRQISATLSDRFSVIYTDSELQKTISLEVAGINSFKDYIEVQNFFTSLAPVKNISLEQLDGEVLTLAIELNSSYEQLKEYLGLSGKLNYIDTLSYELHVEGHSADLNKNLLFQQPSSETNHVLHMNQSPQNIKFPEYKQRQLRNVDKYRWMGNPSSTVQ